MAHEQIIQVACNFAIVVLGVAFFLTVWRVFRGPTLPDRVLALDMLVGIAIGFIAVIAIRTGYTLYIDIAIALGLVGFLATVAFARFIIMRGRVDEDEPLGETPSVGQAPSAPGDIKPAGGRSATAKGRNGKTAGTRKSPKGA